VKTPSSHGHEDVRHETAAWKKELFQRTKRTWEWKNSLGLARFDGGDWWWWLCNHLLLLMLGRNVIEGIDCKVF
jgi:hypothetical protein